MTDLLVKLYDLPDSKEQVEQLAQMGIYIHRVLAGEKDYVVKWVKKSFGNGWSGECDVAFSMKPISCMIAVTAGQMVGFACHDCTCANFFGPIGIDPKFCSKGVGKTILLVTLEAMAQMGYAYAIIGGAGPMAFFEKCAGAMPIPGSTPGIYRHSHQLLQRGKTSC